MRGFSLVELSIVLVILGLLTGGILAGQSLIRASEIRSVSTEFQRYTAAAHTFRDKYMGLPGDLNNATAFWGAAHATPATCLTTVGTGTQTCNGNADGLVNQPANASEYGESYAFWQHLANAGLIEGTYTGRAGTGSTGHVVIDSNAPRAKLGNNATWYVSTVIGGGSYAFAMPTGNKLMFGGQTSANWNYNPVLTIEEAWNIDTKMDDGQATQGSVWAIGWNTCTPATADTDYENYDFGVAGIMCGLAFRNPF